MLAGDLFLDWYTGGMQEAIEEFIKYTELSEPTLEGRIVRYQQLLRGIATGSWSFSKEFQAWRTRICADPE